MRVTEQIDALESLGRSPASHLLVPRILACLLMIPVLTVIADVIGVFSGWYLIKAFFFAASIAVTSTYMGFTTQHGAEGVGKATTVAVVSSSVLILLLDTLLARLLLHG